MAKKVNSVARVIETLGGVEAVATMFGLGKPAVHNWIHRGFPPETYVAMTAALQEKDCTADASLWQMREAINQ